ncbi:hypothetical protein KGF54_003645 [Candida jiufengensis]|uniref:uncharacterized protein n=1 Tax=Candida jiufengensis TaxID=497108 RepID=UPI002224FDA0|nr:uncharacterized protein KGF54_003645 [Candida jiufengensis]KAI5952778.1 hypothetical protein KGF54_003645 [Candida jiufengensis]
MRATPYYQDNNNFHNFINSPQQLPSNSQIYSNNIQQQQPPPSTQSQPQQPRHTSSKSFDFSSLSAELPPNTGPPGSVPITNGLQSSNNKNLSHVPCKFYKQGICQAGDSCPFSHNIEGALAADKIPCKYFLKGNCKFGLKCALAHYLPDGTRVNPKNYIFNQNQNSNGYNNYTHKQQQQQQQQQQQYSQQQFLQQSQISQKQPQIYNQQNISSTSPDHYPQSQEEYNPINISPTINYNHISFKNDSQVNNSQGPITFNSISNDSLARSSSFKSFSNSNNNKDSSLNSSPVAQTRTNTNQYKPITHQNNYQPFGSNPNSTSNSYSNSFNLNSSNFFNNDNLNPNSNIPTNSLNQPLAKLSRSYSTGLNNSNSISPPNQFFNSSLKQQQFPSYTQQSQDFTPTSRYSFNSQTYSGEFGSFKNSIQEGQQYNFSSSAVFDEDDEDQSHNNHTNQNEDDDDEDDDDDTHYDLHKDNGGASSTSNNSNGSRSTNNVENGNNNIFEEDFLPSSLADVLLTPQELQRRDSRSQSGTLNIRPNFNNFRKSYISNSNVKDDDKILNHEDVFLME